MPLLNLKIWDFRNYQLGELNFAADRITCLVGNNGSGKTNILEAIFILALGKSFRVKNSEQLISWNEQFGRIIGQFDLAGKAVLKEVFFGMKPNPKQVFKTNSLKTPLKNWLGQIKIVLFQPEDLNILYQSPELRRKYLDFCCLQLFPEYLSTLKNYEKLRKQKNALLLRVQKNLAKQEELQIWNERMAEEGAKISQRRCELIQKISTRLNEKYEMISSLPAQIEVQYQHCLFSSSPKSPSQPPSYSEILAEMERQSEREISSGHCRVGPHRDDLLITMRGKNLTEHASRGEIRSLMLALKLIELELYQNEIQSEVLVLLDDVFSELDEERQKCLLTAVSNTQTIITTTPDHLYAHQGLSPENSQIIFIDQGRIRE